MVLKDCVELDPAVRYQIAKNAFERALFEVMMILIMIMMMMNDCKDC